MSKNISNAWFNSGYGSFSQAFASATQVVSDVQAAASSFAPIYSTIASTTATFSKYIINQKTSTPAVNFCSTSYESTIISTALQAATGALLITYSATSMAALLTASVVATHPLETIETLKHVGSALYHTAETGAYIAKGCAEISIGSALSAIDTTSVFASNISLMGDSFADEAMIDYDLIG